MAKTAQTPVANPSGVPLAYLFWFNDAHIRVAHSRIPRRSLQFKEYGTCLLNALLLRVAQSCSARIQVYFWHNMVQSVTYA
jgi:hypothetical protein